MLTTPEHYEITINRCNRSNKLQRLCSVVLIDFRSTCARAIGVVDGCVYYPTHGNGETENRATAGPSRNEGGGRVGR